MNLHQPARKFFNLILILSITVLASGFDVYPAIPEKDTNQTRIDQFDLITATSGWVLSDGQLFQTSNAGQTWAEIGPTIPTGAVVQDIEFIDINTGWALLTTIQPGGETLFDLAYTNDGGITWSTRALSLFESGEISSQTEKAEMGWFDAQTGWVSVKQVSGSNFSIGTLFTTSDGGDTWKRFELPVADQITFDDPQNGWAVGGPMGDQVFRTQDGGSTWQNLSPEHNSQSAQVTAYPPVVLDGHGLLIMTDLGLENNLNVYHLDSSSGSWLLFDQIQLNVQPGLLGLSIFDSQNFVATVPGTSSMIRMAGDEVDMRVNEDGLSASIVDLDMISLDIGWAKSVVSNCETASSSTDGTASVTCASTTRLLGTTDGGTTWQNIVLPFVNAFALSDSPSRLVMTTSTMADSGNTNLFIGQGFDKCQIPTLSQLQTWWTNSPYKTVNLYIGGSSRACANSVLTSSYLEQLDQQGWQFIPTWVGPQAPCTGYNSRMSSEIAVAYDEGVNEANLAVERLAELGLTFPDKTGSVVYYDIEPYGTNTACRTAVNSFMDGWVSQLHARGNIAGVYGSTLCNTALSDFLTIPNVPDVIWPARWYHNLGEGFYDPTATVWNLGSCIPNTVWANHQRVRQYEGDHNETWGGMTLGIDSNVLDGVVATFYTDPLVESITRAGPNPTNRLEVDFTVLFSELVTGVSLDDFTLTTTGITGAIPVSLSGSGNVYTVTVHTGMGENGTLRLDVLDDDTIVNASNFELGGAGIDNGNFSNGEVYDVARSITFKSQKLRDGWILESSETSNQGDEMDVTSELLYVGDDAQDRQYRSYLSFGTSTLPDSAVVTDVKFRFMVQGFGGGDMFTPVKTHGNLLVDIRKPYFGESVDLTASDFRSVASRNAVGILTFVPATGWYTVTLKDTAFLYVNLKGVSQFRLRVQKDDDDDLEADFIHIFSGDALGANRPQLIVGYYVP